MKKEELGIYIHIPFCMQKCLYCDFVSYINKSECVKEYINCMIKEIQSYDFKKYNITTIYIGGGTPSFIESDYIKEIINVIQNKLEKNDTRWEDIEITIEVNPGTVTLEKLNDYKTVGINRISLGLQATQDRLLKQIGRIHNYKDFLEAYELLKRVGFNNINVDLMIGLPNQSIKDLKESLEKIIKLNPNHISVYSLIIEDGTPISKLLDEEIERQMYWYVKNKLELNGYNHYEISNFSKKGKESKHNLNCWKQKQYIGIGAAAHSYFKDIRYSNTNNIEEYIKNIKENNIEKNKKIEEKQTIEDKKNEFMMLGFRMIEGVDIADFKAKFVDNPLYVYREKIKKLTDEGLIEVDLNNIKLTNKGLDLANVVFEEFI